MEISLAMKECKKNKNYKKGEIHDLIISYHAALESNDMESIHNAFTDIYYFVEKYVYQTLWAKYKILMNNPQHREEISQSVWLKLFDEIKRYDPNKGAITTFISPWISHVVSEYVSKSFKKTSVYYANAIEKIDEAQNYCKWHGLNTNDISLLKKMTGLPECTIKNSLKLAVRIDTISYNTLININCKPYTKPPDELVLEIESEKNIKELVKDALNEEELKILELYLTPDNFNKKHSSYKEIADKLPGSNPQKIKRKLAKIKMKLQNNKKLITLFTHI